MTPPLGLYAVRLLLLASAMARTGAEFGRCYRARHGTATGRNLTQALSMLVADGLLEFELTEDRYSLTEKGEHMQEAAWTVKEVL